MKRISKTARAAFSLIEILVVITIISVLVGLSVPAIGGAQERARGLEELSNLRQIGLSFRLYANDNDNQVLKGANWAAILRFGGNGSDTSSSGVLPESKIFRSPFDRRNIPVSNTTASILSFALNSTRLATVDLFEQIKTPSSLALLGPATTDGRTFTGSLGAAATLVKEITNGTMKRDAGTDNALSLINLLFADLHVETVKLGDYKKPGGFFEGAP